MKIILKILLSSGIGVGAFGIAHIVGIEAGIAYACFLICIFSEYGD